MAGTSEGGQKAAKTRSRENVKEAGRKDSKQSKQHETEKGAKK